MLSRFSQFSYQKSTLIVVGCIVVLLLVLIVAGVFSSFLKIQVDRQDTYTIQGDIAIAPFHLGPGTYTLEFTGKGMNDEGVQASTQFGIIDSVTPTPIVTPTPTITPTPVAATLPPIKGIWTDFWKNRDEIVTNGVGSIAVNTLWIEWDLGTKLPPCAAGEEVYLGECFKIHTAVDDEIKYYSEKNIEVYAVVYGVPERFRVPNCSPISPGMAIFCASKSENLDAFSRFTGMLAHRYDGTSGNGKISGFVIGNEVNRNEWHDVGCGAGTPCNVETWIASYAHFFKAGYDGIILNNPSAKVFVSLDHAFSASFWDRRQSDSRGEPSISAQTFLTQFAQLVGNHIWRVAYHPYNTNLFSSSFSPYDAATSGNITMGNIGILAGWLKKTFPNKPEVYGDIKITEVGFHSGSSSSEEGQRTALCNSFRNVLGTPGITGYIYNRMVDNAQEGGLLLGLRKQNGDAKQAWQTWAQMNRPGHLDCGFELLPFTRLTRGYSLAKGHWASSRLLPSDFTPEFAWRLLYSGNASRSTVALYECGIGERAFISKDYTCEGQQPRGIVGYALVRSEPGLVPLYQCEIPSNADQFVSSDPACEGWQLKELLGYAYPGE